MNFTGNLLEEKHERRQMEQALRRSENRYRQAAEERRSQHETENTLSSLTALLLSETKLDDISELVLETAKKLTTSRYGFGGSIHPDSGALCSHTMTRDIWEECAIADKKAVFKDFSELWGWALTHRDPILVNDPANDQRSNATPQGHIATDAFLGVPAIIGEDPAGMIALANPERPYDDTDLAIALRLATICAMAPQRHHRERALLEKEMEKTADLEKLVQTSIAGAGVVTVSTPVVVSETAVQGTIIRIAGDEEFVISTGTGKLMVETDAMAYDPLDDQGYQQLDVGDRVSVSGRMDNDFIEGRELVADSIVTLAD